MVLDEFAKYCQKRQAEVGVRITQKTADKYHRLLRYMKEYIKAKYRKEDILLTDLDYDFIDGLNTFIQTPHKCHNNGAVNLVRYLKNFILYAIRSEWIENYPFKNYKLKEERNSRFRICYMSFMQFRPPAFTANQKSAERKLSTAA